jgi:Arc/MetJ family transcription regulator
MIDADVPRSRFHGGMRTSIEIDADLLDEAQALTGTRTRSETVDLALRELVARRRRTGVLDLRGRVHWDGHLNESRRGESGSS